MEMRGEHRIPASRQAVWEALNSPDVLKQCIPGCEALEKLSDTEMKATVAVSVGPVKARFHGKVELTDIKAPASYSIVGEGQGGVAGFGKGGADVQLAEENGETVLTYQAKAQVGGKLAQLGSRLIDSTAKKLADQFFTKFANHFSAPQESAGSVSEPATATQLAAGGTAEGVKEAVVDAATTTGEAIGDTAEAAGDAVTDGASAVENAAREAARSTREAAEDLAEGTEKALQNPAEPEKSSLMPVWIALAALAVILAAWFMIMG